MADKTGLELIGAMFVAATLMVVTVGGFVVHAYHGPQVQADGILHLAELPALVSPASAADVTPAHR